MSGNSSRFWVVFCVALGVLMVAGAGLAWAIHSAGMLEVDIHATGPGGVDVTGLRVPAALAHIALAFAPDDIFAAAEDELRTWGPLIGEACDQLTNAPDFTLVEVITRDEEVQIRKQGRSLVIDVEADDQRVHVTVPLRTAEAFISRFH